MIYSQLHDTIDILMDSYGAPWFSNVRKDKFLNLAQTEFVEKYYSRFGLDERVIQKLGPLVHAVRIQNTRAFMTDSIPEFMYFLSMAGYFSTNCSESAKYYSGTHVITPSTVNIRAVKGEKKVPPINVVSGWQSISHTFKPVLTYKELTTSETVLAGTKRRPIPPMQIDDLEEVLRDPFNTPTDDYPKYVVMADNNNHTYVEIYSDSVPVMVECVYLTKPKIIDGTNVPTDIPDIPEHTHDELCKIAVRMMLESVDSPRYKTIINEIGSQDA